jgi:hypothetical protein
LVKLTTPRRCRPVRPEEAQHVVDQLAHPGRRSLDEANELGVLFILSLAEAVLQQRDEA